VCAIRGPEALPPKLGAAQQLAEADPAGWAVGVACCACRRGVEWGNITRFRRAA
jgi:hypothetical protein